jgi:hypothetical protein
MLKGKHFLKGAFNNSVWNDSEVAGKKDKLATKVEFLEMPYYFMPRQG